MFKDYIDLIKFRYHPTFISVLFGALIFADKIDKNLLISIFLVYISFNLLTYTGLYTFNDLIDHKSDMLHPTKKHRAIPSGRISRNNALIFGVLALLIGLVMGYLVYHPLIWFYLAFTLINLFYSFYAKKVPYLEILTNSITHPLRFVMGAALVGAIAPIGLILVYFLISLNISTERRIHEMRHPGHLARKVLKYYNPKQLSFVKIAALILILLITLINFPLNFQLYMVLIFFYLICMLIQASADESHSLFNKIWLK